MTAPPMRMLAAMAIIQHEHKLLLVQNNWPDGPAWSLPGGQVETNETLAEALAREVREETGLLAEMSGIAYVNEKQWRETYGMFVACTAKIVGGRVDKPANSEEIQAVDFVAEDKVADLIELPAVRLPLVSWLNERPEHPIYFLTRGEACERVC